VAPLPARTRLHTTSPFTEEETRVDTPVVMDMVKPHPPVEGAWGNSKPTASELALSDAHLSCETESKKTLVSSCNFKVSPAKEAAAAGVGTGNQKGKSSLFVASNSKDPPPQDANTPDGRTASAGRQKSKCVIS